MDPLVKKAWRYVVQERVVVTYRSQRGAILDGMVRGGGSQVYRVTVDPAGSWCNCTYGRYNPGKAHSHTLAVQLQDKADHPEEAGLAN